MAESLQTPPQIGCWPRSAEFEREGAAAVAQTLVLEALQVDILRIASMRVPDEAIAQLLRATHETLGFARGIYFAVDRERGIEARWEIGRSSEVQRSAAVLHDESPLLEAMRRKAWPDVARADGVAPLADVRGAYMLSPLRQGTATFGILYLDGQPAHVAPSREAQYVRALTEAASLSIGNSMRVAGAHELACRDALTGLYNRRALTERLSIEMEACRERGHSLSFVMVDLDDLKGLNDSRGHVYGDAVLKHVAEALTRGSRVGDTVGRYGGDEFVVILPSVHAELAAELVARLSSELRSEHLSCSIGAALFPRDAADACGLTVAADRALYASKAAGKNGFVLA